MGTGSSKKTNLQEEKSDNENNLGSDNIRMYSRKTTNPVPVHIGLQPMRRQGRQMTLNHNKLNLDISKGLSQKKFMRKVSDEYCRQFKQKYQEGNGNTLLSHLAESLTKPSELTQEQIEEIHKKYLPKYIFDWVLETDEKSGQKIWKNKRKIIINAKSSAEIQKLIKKPIGATEPFFKKRAWLYHYLSQDLGERFGKESNKIIIDKNNIFESSFLEFKKIKVINLKLTIEVYFSGEKYIDNEVSNKYWYSSLFRDIFSKERKLFRENTNESLGKGTLLFYPKYSGMNMEYYEFVGKLILKSFFDRINIKGFKLNHILLNPIIKRLVTIEDIKYYDINLYKTLKSINDSIIKGNKDFEKYNFMWKIKDENNNFKEIELINNGKNIFLNDENKFQFIEKVIYQETIEPYKEQIKYFQKGIFSILDDNLKGIFSIDELNFLICGQSDIELDDWKENTEYKGDYNENHKVIKMFWDKMKKLKKEELTKFLEFSTGLSNIPIDGFSSLKKVGGRIQKFTIEPYINFSSENENKYEFKPMDAQPWLNRLILPEYPNSQEMDKAFEIVLKN